MSAMCDLRPPVADDSPRPVDAGASGWSSTARASSGSPAIGFETTDFNIPGNSCQVFRNERLQHVPTGRIHPDMSL
ncbi:hypothetical protein OCS_00222 [Ophiocordyceps sinensis CO18]|uniref:Uncharacterized protein n=1 Tax=Ophiocordyceps sinensis (strain Co18 / CGMCC 3.14243) TaxID=911162 RepID=T5AQN8_OPHSC|nr:hypothetical protein OCS_00222 [Ophiocordyceps sinensis CO18]